jgi:DNA polymerase I-like protein with 3'-5' exonuclease and polymerase domains
MGRIIQDQNQIPLLTPKTSWSPPVGPLPVIRNATIAIDTETRDQGLARRQGPGWPFIVVGRPAQDQSGGYICGVSVAWPGGALYVPLRHPETENRDPSEVIRWVSDLIRHNHCVFFNAPYDLGWLRAEGVDCWPERMDDAWAQAVLIDENYETFNLDDCCRRVGIVGKDEQLLNEAAAAYGIKPFNGSIKHGLWLIPARYVGPYAEQDAVATLKLYEHQRAQIEEQKLDEAYRTEIELMQVVHHMRKRGIRVSEIEADKAKAQLHQMMEDELQGVQTPTDWRRKATLRDLRSATKLAEIFDAENIPYPRTAKTKSPQFVKQWLENHPHPVCKKIRRVRQLADLSSKFIDQYILGHTNRGRIHAEIHQLKSDEGGTETLRFAYSAPPLQQMPSRDPVLAPIIRSVFLPEEGTDWLAADYKSQEPRLLIHFANRAAPIAPRFNVSISGIDGYVRHYREDPNPDMHTLTAGILGMTRKKVKDLTQALSYRMGAPKLAKTMGISDAEAIELWTMFHLRIPYIKGLAEMCERQAKDKGFIRLIDGARRHYPFWQPKNRWDMKFADGQATYARFVEACLKWPGEPLERAMVYQAMNSLIQGSAARQMKRGMVDVFNSGRIPLITMHDELGTPVTCLKDCLEVGEIMRDCVKLDIPVGIDLEVGPTWGKATTAATEYYRERMAA